MGRPRVHDAQTAADLLIAAEAMIEEEGLAALSMRALAQRAQVTTRAIYSLFESKDALLGDLAARAFDLLGQEVTELPVTDDPKDDLIAAGLAFRSFASAHPSLCRLAFNADRSPSESWPSARPAQLKALGELTERVARVAGGGLNTGDLSSFVLAFHAQCEGLAALEHRGALANRDAEETWRTALEVCVHGIAGLAAGEPVRARSGGDPG